MNRQAIIERVKIKLDELTPVSEGLDHPIDKYIDPCLDDAARRIIDTLPIELFRIDDYSSAPGFSEPCYTIPLTDDVARVVSVYLSDWIHPVSKIIDENSMEALWQKNPITRGGFAKPVVVLRQEGNSRFLDCYSGTASATHNVRCVLYKKPEEMHDNLIQPLVIQCALLVAMTLERDKAVNVLMSEMKGYYGSSEG